MKSVVAIVGTPNVGKSTLFNKLAGERISIVENTPGVTRDRIFADATWLDNEFTIIDTGGIEPATEDLIPKMMRYQAQIAIDSADVILFVVDSKIGLTPQDKEVAQMLRVSKKPVVVAVNKVDTGKTPDTFYEFYELGFEHMFEISAGQGLGIGDLLDEIVKYFPKEELNSDDEEYVPVAIVGKPNAGKSSLLNALAQEERVIVSPIAGTTRDAIDEKVVIGENKFIFIDTSGIRRKNKILDSIEKYSVIRAHRAIDRAKVVLLVIDATEGVTEQDTKIAGLAHEAGKAVIIVINKWDLVEKETNTMKKFTQKVRTDLAFMPYAPIIYTIAATGGRLKNLPQEIMSVYEEAGKRLATGVLNDVISEAIMLNQPPSDKGKRLKIYYATQISTFPPTFVIFCNSKELFHFSYQRYIENKIRENFGFEGTPIQIVIRERGENDKK